VLTFVPLSLYRAIIKKCEKQTLGVRVVASQRAEPKDTLLFIHGWPDSGKLWTETVELLREDYKCIVVTLPGFECPDKHEGEWGYDFTTVRDMIIKATEKHMQQGKCTLIAHDWGSLFAMMIQQKRPDLVSRMCCLDVGMDGIEKSPSMYLFTISYQWFNIIAFFMGGLAGTFMNQCFLKFGCNYQGRPIANLNSPSLNYNYFYMWKHILFGSKESIRMIAPSTRNINFAQTPMYYGFATRKPGMFHGKRFIQRLEENAKNGGKCVVQKFNCGHWITVSRGRKFIQGVTAWLDGPSSIKKKN
jgi:pimeloyl-ACP methyl ester carboxylesterase